MKHNGKSVLLHPCAGEMLEEWVEWETTEPGSLQRVEALLPTQAVLKPDQTSW